MRPSTSLAAILTLTVALSSTARAEEILPPFGNEVQAAQGAASGLAVAASQLIKETNLFLRKNQLGNPQQPQYINPHFQGVFYEVRNLQAAANALQAAIGTPNAVASYENARRVVLNLSTDPSVPTSIRRIRQSGLKNALDVGREFDAARNAFENVRGYFITRWKNKQWVSASATRAIDAVQYSVERLKQLLDQPVNPGPIAGNPAQSVERTRVVIAQMRVIRDDAQNFQTSMMYAARDPRNQWLQNALNEMRQSVQILNQLAARPAVMADAVTETAAVIEAVRQLDEAYTAELQN